VGKLEVDRDLLLVPHNLHLRVVHHGIDLSVGEPLPARAAHFAVGAGRQHALAPGLHDLPPLGTWVSHLLFHLVVHFRDGARVFGRIPDP